MTKLQGTELSIARERIHRGLKQILIEKPSKLLSKFMIVIYTASQPGK